MKKTTCGQAEGFEFGFGERKGVRVGKKKRGLFTGLCAQKRFGFEEQFLSFEFGS